MGLGNRGQVNHSDYEKCKKILKREIRRTKRGYDMDLAGKIKENSKRFYSYIKSKRVARERIDPLKNQYGHLCVEPQEMGEIFNEYFSSVFTAESTMGAQEIRETSGDVLGRCMLLGRRYLQPYKSKLLRMLESETKRENAGKSQQVWQHL